MSERAVLSTNYGRLVADLTKALASSDMVKILAATGRDDVTQILVSEAVRMADEVVRQTQEANTRLLASQPKPTVDWAPEGSSQETRSGSSWTPEEEEALVAEFILGHSARQIAAYHRRTMSSVLGRLCSAGRLIFIPGQGHLDRLTGERYA